MSSSREHSYLYALGPDALRRFVACATAVGDLGWRRALTDQVTLLEAELIPAADSRRAASAYRELAEAAKTRRDIEHEIASLYVVMAQLLEGESSWG
ncbi:hypothetical protein [Nocardioides sp.]|uniref:hypothetical protein n=1 Tax=Nocardioides sp. TaxID=35761 RepID=UPI003783D350